MYKIFIVEDDKSIAKSIKKHICSWGFDCFAVDDFRKVMEEFTTYQPELVLLDVNLPFFNGYHWCTEIRTVSKVPIIFISSFSDNMNIVMAMNMGADDFIAKPFDLNVLTAKVQAFPMVKKLLNLLNLSNTDLFVWCLLGTILVFAVVYAIVYSLTSRIYYKIVE